MPLALIFTFFIKDKMHGYSKNHLFFNMVTGTVNTKITAGVHSEARHTHQ